MTHGSLVSLAKDGGVARPVNTHFWRVNLHWRIRGWRGQHLHNKTKLITCGVSMVICTVIRFYRLNTGNNRIMKNKWRKNIFIWPNLKIKLLWIIENTLWSYGRNIFFTFTPLTLVRNRRCKDSLKTWVFWMLTECLLRTKDWLGRGGGFSIFTPGGESLKYIFRLR